MCFDYLLICKFFFIFSLYKKLLWWGYFDKQLPNLHYLEKIWKNIKFSLESFFTFIIWINWLVLVIYILAINAAELWKGLGVLLCVCDQEIRCLGSKEAPIWILTGKESSLWRPPIDIIAGTFFVCLGDGSLPWGLGKGDSARKVLVLETGISRPHQ